MLSVAAIRTAFVHNRDLHEQTRLKEFLGITSWKSIVVEHSVEAYALRIDWNNGFSLVYSGA